MWNSIRKYLIEKLGGEYPQKTCELEGLLQVNYYSGINISADAIIDDFIIAEVGEKEGLELAKKEIITKLADWIYENDVIYFKKTYNSVINKDLLSGTIYIYKRNK